MRYASPVPDGHTQHCGPCPTSGNNGSEIEQWKLSDVRNPSSGIDGYELWELNGYNHNITIITLVSIKLEKESLICSARVYTSLTICDPILEYITFPSKDLELH